jgi:hypothetical protein
MFCSREPTAEEARRWSGIMMKKRINRFTRLRRLVNLLATFLFFFSSYVSPAISGTGVLCPGQDSFKAGNGPRSGYEEPDAMGGGEGIAEMRRDIEAESEQKDCARLPGMAWNPNRTACISCAEYQKRFAAALNVNDLNSAQNLLNEAVNCPWYSKSASALEQRRRHQERCQQIDAALTAASKAKDINRFRALVERARAERCDFYQKAYNHLHQWEHDARCRGIDAALTAASKAKDINRFRALVEQARAERCDFCQKAYNHLRQWEQDARCRQIDLALVAASQAKDIKRFRALVEQARGENCDFCQAASNYLRNWERQQQRSRIKPQPQPQVKGQP